MGALLQLLNDNSPENIDEIMRKTLKDPNVDHVTTTFYHLQSNDKVQKNA